MTTEFLLDRLAEASVSAPGPNHVQMQRIAVGRDCRSCLFQHPPSTVTFLPLKLGRRPVLHLGCGIKPVAWRRMKAGVGFVVALEDERHCRHELLQVKLAPGQRPVDRGWQDHQLDLQQFAGQAVRLRFETRVAGSDSRYCWAAWSDLRLEHDIAAPSPPRRRDPHRHVLLITADALRADHLACYGHPFVQTPNLDRLARQGYRFTHARSQSSATMASYASLLTGRHPLEHGITVEWGELAPNLTTLPELLARHGYHTVMLHGEAELGERATGIPTRFHEVLPCLGVPAQDGAVTVRQFTRWLDQRPDQPFFAWLQFFDTHPPCTPPEPFRSYYYQGDPTDARRAYQAEAMFLIRGVEDLEKGLRADGISAASFSPAFVRRLEDTAATLIGHRAMGPDLVSHLRALGPRACRQLPADAFGHWLAQQVRLLKNGQVPTALLNWVRQIVPMLLEIEADILSWLEGVRDFRYVLAQYQSQVSYLDHHIGLIRAGLQERGLDEQTMIVFTSPHGEALTECGVHLHHHVLMEAVLRVPLIIKPGCAEANQPSGGRVDGIFDLIDLAPTLVEALGLPEEPSWTGSGRWRHIQAGSPIPAHHSLAVDMAGTMFALARPPLVYLHCDADTYQSPEWQWSAGERGLFHMQAPMDYAANLKDRWPRTTRQMEQRLTAWRSWLGRRAQPASPRKAA